MGAISAARVSGWEGLAYVVETLDEEGAKLVDAYRLQNGGRRLQRDIEIWHRDKKILGLVQEFAQVSSGE